MPFHSRDGESLWFSMSLGQKGSILSTPEVGTGFVRKFKIPLLDLQTKRTYEQPPIMEPIHMYLIHMYYILYYIKLLY